MHIYYVIITLTAQSNVNILKVAQSECKCYAFVYHGIVEMFIFLSTFFVFAFVPVCFNEKGDGMLAQQTTNINRTYVLVATTTAFLFLILLNKIK